MYKTCPDCEAEVPFGTVACSFCGHAWRREVREKRPLQRFGLTEIDLLDRSPFRWWDMHGDGHAMIASGFDAWAGVFFDGEHWHAAIKSRLWLNHPASPRQRELLIRAGDADPALDFGLSKYAANCRLNFLWHRPQILAAVFPHGVVRAA